LRQLFIDPTTPTPSTVTPITDPRFAKLAITSRLALSSERIPTKIRDIGNV
jgi:hypothetical protein